MQLRNFVRPKCHPLLLDPGINSPLVIHSNLYRVFLIAAMKFHVRPSSVFALRKNEFNLMCLVLPKPIGKIAKRRTPSPELEEM